VLPDSDVEMTLPIFFLK